MTLIEALKKRPHSTATQLAKLMKVSIPTVHRRIKAARAAEIRIYGSVCYTGKTGPVPMQYVLEKQ